MRARRLIARVLVLGGFTAVFLVVLVGIAQANDTCSPQNRGDCRNTAGVIATAAGIATVTAIATTLLRGSRPGGTDECVESLQKIDQQLDSVITTAKGVLDERGQEVMKLLDLQSRQQAFAQQAFGGTPTPAQAAANSVWQQMATTINQLQAKTDQMGANLRAWKQEIDGMYQVRRQVWASCPGAYNRPAPDIDVDEGGTPTYVGYGPSVPPTAAPPAIAPPASPPPSPPVSTPGPQAPPIPPPPPAPPAPAPPASSPTPTDTTPKPGADGGPRTPDQATADGGDKPKPPADGEKKPPDDKPGDAKTDDGTPKDESKTGTKPPDSKKPEPGVTLDPASADAGTKPKPPEPEAPPAVEPPKSKATGGLPPELTKPGGGTVTFTPEAIKDAMNNAKIPPEYKGIVDKLAKPLVTGVTLTEGGMPNQVRISVQTPVGTASGNVFIADGQIRITIDSVPGAVEAIEQGIQLGATALGQTYQPKATPPALTKFGTDRIRPINHQLDDQGLEVKRVTVKDGAVTVTTGPRQ